MNETWLYSSPPGLSPLPSATQQVTIQLRAAHHADQHMSLFLGTLSAQAQWDSTDGTVHAQVQERRERCINDRACFDWAVLQIVKEISLRQVQDEEHGSEQSAPLLFKPHSSTHLSTRCPF